MIVSLVGLRGVGKTTLARELARQLRCDWLDLDSRIEQRAGRSVADLLTREGEPAFRDLESAALAEALESALSRDALVLATGGGVVLRESNRQRLAAAGPVVWLQASPGTLRARLAPSEHLAARPALTPAGTLGEIDALAAQREPLYRQVATLTVSTEHRSVESVAGEIVDALRAAGHAPPGESPPR